MKPLYFLSESGRMPVKMEGDLEQCKKELREIADIELKRAKRLSKQAHKHKLSDKAYTITLGPDRDSSLWTSLVIVDG